MSSRRVSIHYTLKDRQGNELDSSLGGDPLTFVEGIGQIIPGLEEGLRPLKTGDKKKIEVKFADAAHILVHQPA